MSNIRIATFNLENLDHQGRSAELWPRRLEVMRPQLSRVNADILCLQEVHGQETAGEPRQLLSLDLLLEGTQYANYRRAHTVTSRDEPYDKRNLVTLCRGDLALLEHRQIHHDLTPKPAYRKVTANPPEAEADEVSWERPILYARIQLPDQTELHVINLHLKSKLPSNIPGQRRDRWSWRSVAGWAEGYFLSSMKRVGQALETRIFIDELFDADPGARIVICGDLNADSDSVPVRTLRGPVSETGNPDLSGRILIPCEDTIPESSRYSHLHHGHGNLLDHLLISRSLLGNYVGAEIHNEVLPDESVSNANDKIYPEPDHAPVVAAFDMRQR